MSDKHELIQKARKLKAEVINCKRQLRTLNDNKQEEFSKRDELRKEFRVSIKKIKEFRVERDKHTKIVKDLKEKRSIATSSARKAASVVEKLKGEKDKTTAKFHIKKSADMLRKEIEKIEFRIETEGMKFSDEEKLMKIIKEKKAELSRASELKDVETQLKGSSKKLYSSRSVSNIAHRQLQEHASKSQSFHEQLVVEAKKADKLKASMKPIDKALDSIIKQFGEIKKELIEKENEMKTLEVDIDKLKVSDEKKRKEDVEKRISDTEKRLTEKIKSGKKITTDDLIKLQG